MSAAAAGVLRKVQQRIRALLVLAQEDRGGTPAEREVAARKAQVLADRHGVDLAELAAIVEEGGDREPGELLVELHELHWVWSAMLLDRLALPLGVEIRPGAGSRERLLRGPAGAVAQTARAHTEAFAAIEAAHRELIAHADLRGRRALRYLLLRYPDPALHGDVVAQLRYWPTPRLAREVREVLALRPAAAAEVAQAIQAGRVAAVDVDPEALELPYFAGAIDRVGQRLSELEHHRRPAAPPPLPDEDLAEILTTDPPPRPRPQARRHVPWDPAAHAAGLRAGAGAPIGLLDVA